MDTTTDDGWIKVGSMTISELLERMRADPEDLYQPLRVGEKREHGVTFDEAWALDRFWGSLDRNKRLHMPKRDRGRGLVQGTVLLDVLGSMASHAVHDAGPVQVNATFGVPVRIGDTVRVRVEVISHETPEKGKPFWRVRLAMLHAEGLAERFAVEPAEVSLYYFGR